MKELTHVQCSLLSLCARPMYDALKRILEARGVDSCDPMEWIQTMAEAQKGIAGVIVAQIDRALAQPKQ